MQVVVNEEEDLTRCVRVIDRCTLSLIFNTCRHGHATACVDQQCGGDEAKEGGDGGWLSVQLIEASE
eukprot:scaffold5945_cov85-Alexandrium_tamarense.AAC.3